MFSNTTVSIPATPGVWQGSGAKQLISATKIERRPQHTIVQVCYVTELSYLPPVQHIVPFQTQPQHRNSLVGCKNCIRVYDSTRRTQWQRCERNGKKAKGTATSQPKSIWSGEETLLFFGSGQKEEYNFGCSLLGCLTMAAGRL